MKKILKKLLRFWIEKKEIVKKGYQVEKLKMGPKEIDVRGITNRGI
jgi:hypothetical protein